MRIARLHKDESGAILAMTAIIILVMIGMVMLVVDVGGLVSTRRRLVTASDSAALAGARACAEGRASELETDADEYAVANQEASTGGVTNTPDCNARTGTVTVRYHKQQKAYFAPILGLKDSNDVSARASAEWGPAASGAAPPFMLSRDWITECGFNVNDPPYPDPSLEPTCSLWFDDDNLTGGEWGKLNLNSWGQTTASGPCNFQATNNDIDDWIENGYPDDLTLTTIPTYVCTLGGMNNADWQKVNDNPGLRYFPINNKCLQVDNHGNLEPGEGCPGEVASPNVDKYAIIGFAPVRILSATKLNDPLSGVHCTRVNIGPLIENQVVSIAGLIAACLPPGATLVGVNLWEDPTSTANNQEINVNWWEYFPATQTIQWQHNQDQTDAYLEVTYNENNLCAGAHNGSGACVTVSWPGRQVTSGPISSTGEDFGLRAVRLSE